MVAGELHRRQGQIEALIAEVASYSENLAALDTAIAIADILGAMQSQEERRLRLKAKQQKLEQQLSADKVDSQRTEVTIGRLKANMQAMDSAIGMVHSSAAPDSLSAVQAWAGRYGERGALTAFVKSTLQACAPNLLTMTVLMDMAATQFGQSFSVPEERRSFRKSVRSALNSLHKKGCIEPLHSGEGSEHGQWRWKPAVSSFEDLLAQAQQRGL